MSVILNALRSKEAAKTANEKVWPKEGLFFATPEKAEPSWNSSRISVMIIILFAASAFAIVRLSFRYFALPATTVEASAPLSELALPTLPLKPSMDLATAKSLFAQNKLDDSLAAYQQLLNKSPNNAMLLNDMGLILLKQNRMLEAESRMQEAVKADPRCAECYNNLGLLATQDGRLSDAEKHLKAAIALKSGYADPYFNLAVVFEKTGEQKQALASFENFLKNAPDKNAAIVGQVKSHIAKMSAIAE